MKNLFIILQLIFFLYGQTGKIIGNIKDSETNEPLVGVSVMVVGKGIGADTDQDGRYSIINVPIGKHDIKTSIIGYASSINALCIPSCSSFFGSWYTCGDNVSLIPERSVRII